MIAGTLTIRKKISFNFPETSRINNTLKRNFVFFYFVTLPLSTANNPISIWIFLFFLFKFSLCRPYKISETQRKKMIFHWEYEPKFPIFQNECRIFFRLNLDVTKSQTRKKKCHKLNERKSFNKDKKPFWLHKDFPLSLQIRDNGRRRLKIYANPALRPSTWKLTRNPKRFVLGAST